MATSLTPQQVQDLKNKIADAEAQYHSLMIGTSVTAFVDQNGEQMRYSVQTRADLYAYIQELKAALPTSDASYVAYPKPLSFFF